MVQYQPRQPLFDDRPGALEPRGQPNRCAQLLGRLVGREPRTVGSYLEQNTPRLTVVDRVEVLPVSDRRNIVAQLGDLLPPGRLLIICRRPPGDVMDGTHRDDSRRGIWPANYVHVFP